MTDTTGQHEVVEPVIKNPLINDVWYKRLEYLGRVVLPGFATMYLALSTLWLLPKGAEVVGTIVAVDTFLGVFLGYAQKTYDASNAAYNGSLDVIPKPDGGTLYSLNLDTQPEALADMSKVTFKINTQETS